MCELGLLEIHTFCTSCILAKNAKIDLKKCFQCLTILSTDHPFNSFDGFQLSWMSVCLCLCLFMSMSVYVYVCLCLCLFMSMLMLNVCLRPKLRLLTLRRFKRKRFNEDLKKKKIWKYQFCGKDEQMTCHRRTKKF